MSDDVSGLVDSYTNISDQWLDVYKVHDTQLEHIQRGSAIPDGKTTSYAVTRDSTYK